MKFTRSTSSTRALGSGARVHAGAPPTETTWITQQRTQLERHVAQCWSRPAAVAAAHGLDLLHMAVGRRFVTTLTIVGAVVLVPALWR